MTAQEIERILGEILDSDVDSEVPYSVLASIEKAYFELLGS